MAVFVSASDERSGKDRKGDFFLMGWIAPEEDWSRFFAPSWQERVLDGPPKIPYLHMTEIRSQKWREQYGLSPLQASNRVDEAVSIIKTMGSLFPISVDVDGGHFREQFGEHKMIAASGGKKTFEPDYMCFIAYAYAVLLYLNKKHPEAKRVDFMVEGNGEITKHIQEFHSHLAGSLKNLHRPELEQLVGKLLPIGKERAPVQAADVLCWHVGRHMTPESRMDDDDIRRYTALTKRQGKRIRLEKNVIEEIERSFKQHETKIGPDGSF